MTNTKISNNNPDKEPIINKSITKTKDNEIIKNKTNQNKKSTSERKKPNKSLDDIFEVQDRISDAVLMNIIPGVLYLDVANERVKQQFSPQVHLNRLKMRVSYEKHSPEGLYEYEIQEIMEKEFRMQGAKRNGYPSIVASGKNACILHYVSNDKKLENNDLILIDAGSEWDYYSADITRTWPVNGRFSSEQKDIYQLVLEANSKAIEECKVGNTINEPHMKALTTCLLYTSDAADE